MPLLTNKKNKNNTQIKEKLAEILELPKEIVLDVPKITVVGNSNFVIENYKGIVEFRNDKIRINIGKGFLKIQGDLLTIKEITSETITIVGKLNSIEFTE
jgi:sporulation protein YqfC